MPTPRMSTPQPARRTFDGNSPSVLLKAVVMGAVSDNNNTFYVSVSGAQLVRAEATIDAAIDVGSVVYVQQSGGGWLITGTA